jgi:hypothetical protein
MAAEALLARQGLRATGGDGSHVCRRRRVSPVRRGYRSIRQADLRTVQAYASYGAVVRSVGRADHQTRRRMGSREGNGGGSRSAGTTVSHAARAVRLVNTEREFEYRAASHGLVERTRSGPEPAGLTDCRLHLPSQPPLGRADGLIEPVSVGLPEHQDIDVADRPEPGLPAMTRGPVID